MIFGYFKQYHKEYGLAIPIELGIATYPHVLITGASGSGKSTALLFLLGKLLQADSNIILYFCDFKKSQEFAFLNNEHPFYFAGNDCYKGVMQYYNAFSTARESSQDSHRYILIFDEYPAFINYLQMKDKTEKTKHANEVLNAISEILMLGRGIKFGVWIVTQRPDSTLFANGARDNFMVIIGLGKLSREQKGMIFAGEDLPDTIMGCGEGILLADGKEITEVKYPMITEIADWQHHILYILHNSLL